MKCPKCNMPLPAKLVMSEAARIRGRRASHSLSKDKAREMQKKSVEAKRKKKGSKL